MPSAGRISPNRTLLYWFGRYSAWTLRRAFHAIRVAGTANLEGLSGRPLAVYCNHPGWWDPLIGLRLHQRYLGEREGYAPIEADALERYGFFKHLGFFGVEPGSCGARSFLRFASEILSDPQACLWLTPEGALRDVRERPLRFEPGLGHVAVKAPQAHFVPVAIEYAFAYERRAEALVKIGKPLPGEALAGQSSAAATALLENALSTNMDELAQAVISRDWTLFDHTWGGAQGTDPFWDAWKRLKSLVTGERYHREHASVVRR